MDRSHTTVEKLHLDVIFTGGQMSVDALETLRKFILKSIFNSDAFLSLSIEMLENNRKHIDSRPKSLSPHSLVNVISLVSYFAGKH